MGSTSDHEAVQDALDGVEAALDKLATVTWEKLTPPELLMVLDRKEVLARRAAAIDHPVLEQLARRSSPSQLGGSSLAGVLAARLRISRTEATRRVGEAADLGPRLALTGTPMPPRLTATAAAQARGELDAEHVTIIRGFFDRLPGHVDHATREEAERHLAQLACGLGPEALRKAAARLEALLDPDGTLDDVERARRRGLTIGAQQADGMSRISGFLDPQARATLDAVLAKLAAPGMCNPESEHPRVSGSPTEEEIRADTRTAAQRRHDALTAAGRAVLASGDLGRLNGLPVTVVVSTTVAELESATGHAVTAGGTLLPMSDVLRMAGHALHYLTLFDGSGKCLWLGRTRRVASADQRLVLLTRDRGCTFPGCTVPGFLTQAHHLTDWAAGGTTDIDELALACGPHNRLATEGGWVTRRRADGTVEWIPPGHLDTGQSRTNDYHHPERYLVDEGGRAVDCDGERADTDTGVPDRGESRGELRGEPSSDPRGDP